MRSLLTCTGLLTALFAHVAHAQSGICYYPDGARLPQDGTFFSSMQPCTSGGLSTICCATNRTNPPGGEQANGSTQDECLQNGLCQNRYTTNGVGTTKYYARYCTDSNWNSGECLNVCAQTRDNLGNTEMTPCNGRADSPYWCCGATTVCCGSGTGKQTIAAIFGGNLTTSSAPASGSMTRTTSSPTASTPPSATPASNNQKEEKKESTLGGGAIAGIVIGALAFVALLSALVFFVTRSKKHKKTETRNESFKGDGNTGMSLQYNSGVVNEMYQHPGELPVGHEVPRVSEMPTTPR